MGIVPKNFFFNRHRRLQDEILIPVTIFPDIFHIGPCMERSSSQVNTGFCPVTGVQRFNNGDGNGRI